MHLRLQYSKSLPYTIYIPDVTALPYVFAQLRGPQLHAAFVHLAVIFMAAVPFIATWHRFLCSLL